MKHLGWLVVAAGIVLVACAPKGPAPAAQQCVPTAQNDSARDSVNRKAWGCTCKEWTCKDGVCDCKVWFCKE